MFNPTLTLYRGDFERIEEFRFNKTNKWCLVGQGVYLTDTREVAESYRTKDAPYHEPSTIEATLVAANRDEAKEQFYQKLFFPRVARALTRDMKSPPKDPKKALADKVRAAWIKHLEYDRVTTEYVEVFGRNTPRRRTEPTQIRIKCHLIGATIVGHVSAFRFDRSVINSTMLDLRKGDRLFWEIMWDQGLHDLIGTPYSRTDRSAYIWRNSSERRSISEWGLTNDKYPIIRRAIEPFGYRGFEYRGGWHTSNPIRHRAFCVWDEKFVNSHRIKE